MSDEANVSAQEQRIDAAIAAYLAAVDAGCVPDREEFLAQHADIAKDLQTFFANQDRLNRLAAALPTVATESRQQSATDASSEPNELLIADTSLPVGAGRRFGEYELLEELARGGMGIVYKARQLNLNRIVALKMILAGQLASSEDVQRFCTEAEAAANLDHPGIVPVYDVGAHGGQHYFSMGYVDGCSLAERLRDGPVSSHVAATILHQICDAVHYAHEHGVIHRDLKPANILLETNEASEGARPRITDFGLAKRLTSDSQLTHTGQLLGTPSYMSPEQATAGAKHPIGPSSDIYSLGAILYQLLTGRPPFQAETALDTLSQLLESDPLPPRLLNRNVPRELEAICMKCLAKEPKHRYPSARELGNDLARYLNGEPIRAAGINLLDRVTQALRPSQREEHFREWGFGLMAFGIVILLSHAAIYFLEGSWQPSLVTYFLPRAVMFATLLGMLWHFRHHYLLPTNSAERLVWVVWIGYLLALAASNAARVALGHHQRESYATFAVLAGFGFLIMGGHVWSGGYVVGLVFLSCAPLLALYVEAAPLISGGLWAAALFTFGLHYWYRGRAV